MIRIDSNDGLRLAQVAFEIGLVENGFVFGEYDINTDSHRVSIARSLDELERLIRKWLEERISSINDWAAHKQQPDNKVVWRQDG